MIYLFEFFTLEQDGKHPLDWMRQRASSVDRARDHAKSIMKNVRLRDQVAQLCEVKDPMGNVLSVVQIDEVGAGWRTGFGTRRTS
jgi:hypothetical protein